MSMKFPPRTKETTSITGTGSYLLNGAVTGYSLFSRFLSDQDETFYCCTDGVDWEMATGRYDAATNSIQRLNVVSTDSSTNGLVNWGDGEKQIFSILPHRMLERISSGGNYGAFYTNDSISIGDSNAIVEGSNYSLCLGTGNSCDGDYIYILGRNGSSQLEGGIVLSSNVGAQLQIVSRRLVTYNANEVPVDLGLFYAKLSSLAGSSTLFDISIIARQIDGTSGTVGDSKAWKLSCIISYESYSPAMIGTLTKTVVAASAGASAWDVAVYGAASLPINVTGEADKTIAWVVCVQGVGVM